MLGFLLVALVGIWMMSGPDLPGDVAFLVFVCAMLLLIALASANLASESEKKFRRKLKKIERIVHHINGNTTLQKDCFVKFVEDTLITFPEMIMNNDDKNDDFDLGEEEGFEVLTIDTRFYVELAKRVRKVRKNLTLRSTKEVKYKKGNLYNHDESIMETVVQAVTDSNQAYHTGSIAKKNKEDDILLSGSAIGLSFSAKSVKSGWYDELIKSTLKKMAELDYLKETDPDLH